MALLPPSPMSPATMPTRSSSFLLPGPSPKMQHSLPHLRQCLSDRCAGRRSTRWCRRPMSRPNSGSSCGRSRRCRSVGTRGGASRRSGRTVRPFAAATKTAHADLVVLQVPRSLAAPINLITQQLGQGILQFLTTSDAAFARNIVESIGGAALTPVKPAVVPPQHSHTPAQAGPSHFTQQPASTSFRRPSVSLPSAPNVMAHMQGSAASPTPVGPARTPSSPLDDASTQVQRPVSTGTIPQQLSSPPASASHLTPGRAAPPFPYRPSPTLATSSISQPRSAPVSSSNEQGLSFMQAEDGEGLGYASPGSTVALGQAAAGATQAYEGGAGDVRRPEEEAGDEPARKRTRTA